MTKRITLKKKAGIFTGMAALSLCAFMLCIPVNANAAGYTYGLGTAHGYVTLKGDSSTIQPLTTETVDGGKGVWDYGTNVDVHGKNVWSNLGSANYDHESSCALSGQYDSSGYTVAGTQSRSAIHGGYVWDTGHSYYDIYDD